MTYVHLRPRLVLRMSLVLVKRSRWRGAGRKTPWSCADQVMLTFASAAAMGLARETTPLAGGEIYPAILERVNLGDGKE